MKKILSILTITIFFIVPSASADVIIETNGDTKVTTNLDVQGNLTGPNIQQPLAGPCPADQSIQSISISGAIVCEPDSDSGGDITGVNSVTGLSGGGTSGDVTLNIDPTYTQRRVSDSCIVGSSIRSINEDGTVICQTDTGSDNLGNHSATQDILPDTSGTYSLGSSTLRFDTVYSSSLYIGTTAGNETSLRHDGITFSNGTQQGTSCTTAICDLYDLTGNTKPDICFECSDGLDNDGDGLTDYPDDPMCDSARDDLEGSQKFVFGTSGLYRGDFGGILEADAICQSLASTAGLSGTYKAWLSDSLGNEPASSFTQSNAPYVLVDGTVIANDWADLIDGNIANPINLDENGDSLSSHDAFTCTSVDGTAISYGCNNSCNNWTSTSGDCYGGANWLTDFRWTEHGAPFDCDCSYDGRFFCFQQ